MSKPICKYDPSCYQKNPLHAEKFAHPQRDAALAAAAAAAAAQKAQEDAAKQSQKKDAKKASSDDDDDDDDVPPPAALGRARGGAGGKAAPPAKRSAVPAPKVRGKVAVDLGASSSSGSDNDDDDDTPPPPVHCKSGGAPAPPPKRSKAAEAASSSSQTVQPQKSDSGVAARPSPLSGNDPAALFEMPFPTQEMSAVLAVAKRHNAADPLRAFPGIRLCGPFAVLLGGASFGSDAEKWLSCRPAPLLPPEAQAFAIIEDADVFASITVPGKAGTARKRAEGEDDDGAEGGTGQAPRGGGDDASLRCRSLCFFRDDPADSPFVVASHGFGGRDLVPLHSCVARVLAHVLRGKAAASAAVQDLIACPAVGGEGKLLKPKELADFSAARVKKKIALTFSGIGVHGPYDKKTDVGYRPPLIPRNSLATILKALVAGTQSKKELADMDNQMAMADVANDEGDFVLSLELAQNFLYHAKLSAVNGATRVDRTHYVGRNAMRMFDIGYMLLERDLFGHISKLM